MYKRNYKKIVLSEAVARRGCVNNTLKKTMQFLQDSTYVEVSF